MTSAGTTIQDTTAERVDELIAAAEAASRVEQVPPGTRADWLCAIADALDAAAGELVPLAHQETHLPEEPRLAGELRRTTFQFRLFAEVLAEGAFLDATVDHADPAWPMGPRPDLRRAAVPLGPVLVFAASNFPFAFSVPGGDTASALAAGCPVVCKAHPGHPRLSERVATVVAGALRAQGAPEGMFALIHGVDAGVRALRDPRVAAAAFTGSVPGGRALFDIAAARPAPIPFYGELGSVNPVVVTAGALAARGPEIATGFAGSFTLGAGQFCTKPSLLFLPEGHGLEDALRTAVHAAPAQPMLGARIAEGFDHTLDGLRALPGVSVLAEGSGGTGTAAPALLSTTAAEALRSPELLRTECFGPASIVVTYRDHGELAAALGALEPALTATVHGEEGEADLVRPLLPVLARLAGRVLWNDWPTGVTVSWAQHHGGPYPATTAPTTTSVGTGAIGRFLRPVAWQGFPDALLPPALREDNPWSLPRRTDGDR